MSVSKPSGSKRKLGDEHRIFQEKWELEFFCCEVKDKIICLICNSTVGVPKLYNIKRHYDSHKTKFDKYTGMIRNEKLKELKSRLKDQQLMFTRPKQENESAVQASYVLSELIAKHSKPFVEGEFIKECLVKAAEIVSPGSVKAFQNISLSRNTVAKRVTELAANISEQIKTKSDSFIAFSIACDESTDVCGVAQLAIFLRAVDRDINVYEELLELVPLHDTTTGEDIFNAVYGLLQKYNLDLSKLCSVATDGAPSMTGVNNGFIKILQTKIRETGSDKPDFHHVHCIIHQEVLCSKVIKLESVLKSVKKMINFIRSRGLNQRQFSAFLRDLESEYTGLPYYAEVRWLSCSMVLDRFWKLKEEIRLFMEVKEQDVSLLSDVPFLQDLSFMVDITKHLSDLNTKLQGPRQVITDMHDHVKAFKCKMMLWKNQLAVDNLSHFPTCKAYQESTSGPISYKMYTEKMGSLLSEFEKRFQDFKSQENNFSLFTGLFTIDIDKVPPHLQMEVIEIQCQTHLKEKFDSVGTFEFYKYLPFQYQEMRKFACKILSMFGSTYKCEQLFSLMKGNKSPARSRLTDAHLDAVLKVISADKFTPQIDNLIKDKRCQISGKRS